MADCKLLFEKEAPRIFVMPKALYKMRYYIDNTEDEIGWLGYVHKIDKDQYLIEDVFLLKQKVHSATTEIDAEALASMATELIKQGQAGIDKYNSIRMWGHSHVNMSTGASSQDDKQMEEFATTDYYIRLIGNKKGDWNVCLYDYTNNILWSSLVLELYYDVDVTDEELDEEIKNNVSKITYKSTIGFGTNTNNVTRRWLDNYYDDYYDDYYGGYSPNTKRQADYLREEKETEKEEKEEKIDEPYRIDWELDNTDIRNMKRYYSSEEELCLFMGTAEVKDVIDAIKEDYAVLVSKEFAEEFMESMRDIWNKRYANKYIEEG